MSDQLEDAIKEAKETCEDDPTKADCAVAWDNVSRGERLSLSLARPHAVLILA